MALTQLNSNISKELSSIPVSCSLFFVVTSPSIAMEGTLGDDDIKRYSENVQNGKLWLRKIKRKRQQLLLIELLYEYAKNSTLHGLRYIVEKGLHLIERGFWFLTFLLSLALCFYLIRNVWWKWTNSPVIVSFSESFTPVGDVPFPSITICPELKSKKSDDFDFAKEYQAYEDAYKNMTMDNTPSIPSFSDFKEKRLHKLSNINLLCNTWETIETGRKMTNSSIVEDLTEVAPSVDDVFFLCDWRGEYQYCNDIFKKVLTRQGVCFNFNALHASEILQEDRLQKEYKYLDTSDASVNWSVTEGYTDYQPGITYPRRGMDNQFTPDLVVFLQEIPEQRDAFCNVIKNGYTIYVQHPMDLPQASLYYYAAISRQTSSIAVKFTKVSTADSLKDYSPEVRQCYFPGDKKLRYFRIYTANNCQLECQSNYTFQSCGCVSFYMPHNDSEQICTDESSECVKEALKQLSIAEIKGNKVTNVTSCQCLPLCDNVQYDAEILKTVFNMSAWWNFLSKHDNNTFLKELSLAEYSRVEIYFKEPRYISMRRSELFGVTDFLANCGGLLGLFLGFSFLSLVEIFYFGTLRFYYRLKKEKQQQKKKESEDKKE